MHAGIRVVTLPFTMCLAFGAEARWPELPDPDGLGPRLTTILWLREHGRTVEPGTSDDALQAAYAKETADDTAVLAIAELDRLRYLLRVNHHLTPPADTDRATLAKLLIEAEAAQRDAEFEVSQLATGLWLAPSEPWADVSVDTPVPLRHQIVFRDLSWKILRSTGTPLWKQGGSGELPRQAGEIWARRVNWNGTSYRISSYVENAPEPQARFTITSDVGTFQAVRLTENAWEVVFTDNAGNPLSFRTHASETLEPGGGNRLRQQGETTAAR